MGECNGDEVEREVAALVERRKRQTSAARKAAGERFANDDERREHMRNLAILSARKRRAARIERLRAEARELLAKRQGGHDA